MEHEYTMHLMANMMIFLGMTLFTLVIGWCVTRNRK